MEAKVVDTKKRRLEATDNEKLNYKKKKKEQKNHNQDSDSQEDELLDEFDLQVDFALDEVEEDDYHAIKNLVKGILMQTAFDSAELTKLILDQKEKIGSVITVKGQEDVFGIMSILSLKEHWEKGCIQTILRFVLNRVANSKSFPEWERIVSDAESDVGLVISERISNLPDSLAVPINLVTLEEAKKNFTFRYLLFITNSYKEVDSKNDNSISSTTYYAKLEDEIYRECSVLSHSIRYIRNNEDVRWTLKVPIHLSKVFMLVRNSQFPRIINKLKDLEKHINTTNANVSKQKSSDNRKI